MWFIFGKNILLSRIRYIVKLKSDDEETCEYCEEAALVQHV